MTHETERKASTDRRSLLKLAGAGVVTSGAALVAGGTVAAAAPASASPQRDGEIYRETDHVKRFYELAKSM